jgi:hypothetical protein
MEESDMNRQLVLRLALVLVGALVAVPPALAKGPPDKVSISGPWLEEEIEVTDSGLLEDLAMGTFTDFRQIAAPRVGAGYELVRYSKTQSGTYRAFDRLRYYPRHSGRGYVFYVGIEGGSSEYDGKWFHATASGEAALRRLLARPDVPAAVPASLSIVRMPRTPL